MTTYLIQIVVFQLLFLAVYELFLKRETFFHHNRFYLLATSVLSLTIPFVKIPFLQTAAPETFAVLLPEVLLNNAANPSPQVSSGSGIPILQWILFSGIALSLLYFLWKISRVLLIKTKGTQRFWNNTKVITIPNSKEAFSFVNTIYIGEALSAEERETILRHEAVHVRQKHYLDLLWFEFLRVVFWFNPMVYFYQKRIAETHEYIADQYVAQQNKKDYYLHLLAQTFETTTISFTNTFFNHSFIKKRIVMLQKTKSKKNFQWKYALIVPLLFGMLLYTSCSEENSPQTNDSSLEQKLEELKIQLENQEDLTDSEIEKMEELFFSILKEKTKELDIKNVSGSMVFEKNADSESVPFATIDQVPVYPGCEENSNEELKACFSQKISAFVGEHFDTKLANTLNLEGRQRISVQFAIDNTGAVTNIKARGPHPELEAEAIRIMELLPQMTPGQQEGKTVNVLYSLPILFQVD